MPRCHLAVAAGFLVFAIVFSSVVSAGASPASKYELLYSFQGSPDGAYPMSGLTSDSAGNFYGTTRQGGTGTGCNSGCGTVFELERTENGWKEKTLYSFRGGDDGYFPQAGVVFDSSGNLYGTTKSGGGTNYYGTVFELTRDSRGVWAERLIYRFTFAYGGPDNSLPSELILDAQGNLYGTTRFGGQGVCLEENACGAVYELTPQSDGSWKETTLHTFDDPPDGGNPSSGVVIDSTGNLYGTTEVGGTGTCYPPNGYYDHYVMNCGTIYKLTRSMPTSWTESILYNFRRFRGRAKYPSGGVLFDKAGHVFGTSLAGGNGIGTVFELQHQQDGSWSQSELHLFYGKPDGAEAGQAGKGGILGRLAMDEQGDLFVVTSAGGASGGGTVLELQPRKNGWEPKIVHAFTSAQQGTKSGLVLGPQGHFYGTTLGGGLGTIYEIVP